MTVVRRFVLLSGVVGVLVLAACGGGDDAGDGELATLGSTVAAAGDAGADALAGTEEALLEFAQCVRDNGVPGYPDVALDADGSVDLAAVLGRLDDAGIDPRSEEFASAVNACSGELQGVALGLIGEGFDQTELQDQLLGFADCMRDQGFDVDDPQLSDFQDEISPGDGPFARLDLDDPAVADALELCRRNLSLPGLGGSTGGGDR